MTFPVVHRFEASLLPVNAYLVELPDEVIVIDSTLGMSDGRALRARVGRHWQAASRGHRDSRAP